MTQPVHVKRLPTTGVSPEVIDALDHLSALTGISKAHLIRSVVEQHLCSLGLLADESGEPTRTKNNHERN